MKKLAIIFLIVFATGCAVVKPTPRTTFYYGFDFTKYTSEGFLITPEGYTGEYESVGLLTATIYPAIMNDDNPSTWNKYKAEEVDAADAIDSLVIRAKEMGANAIINFRVDNYKDSWQGMNVNVMEASGFAIKRE